MRRLILMVFVVLLSFAVNAQTHGRAVGRGGEPVALIVTSDVAAAYNALTALEPAERKALYSGLTNELRASLWRLQHQMYIADHPELSAAQRDVLFGVIRHLTPEMYAPLSIQAAAIGDRSELEALHQRAAELFTPQEMDEIFQQLGGQRGVRHNWRLVVNTLCNCASDEECGGICQGRGCTLVAHSCGPDLAYACTGLCQ